MAPLGMIKLPDRWQCQKCNYILSGVHVEPRCPSCSHSHDASWSLPVVRDVSKSALALVNDKRSQYDLMPLDGLDELTDEDRKVWVRMAHVALEADHG